MSVEDPFFVVRGDIEKAVKKCWDLEHQWLNILNEKTGTKSDDYNQISSEFQSSLRNIEWDLEDLDETIQYKPIVQANPKKFSISIDELNNRKAFISNTRQSVQEMKDQMNDPKNKAKADEILRKSLLNNDLKKKDNYSKISIEFENDNNAFLDDHQQKQQLIMEQQDEQLDLVANSVGILKNMSKTIGNELDDQALMLDDMGSEMESTQNRMDTLLQKMSKITRLSNDRRQWCAIGVLGASVFVILLLLIV